MPKNAKFREKIPGEFRPGQFYFERLHSRRFLDRCFKSSSAARHLQPWDNSIKASFAASIDHRIFKFEIDGENQQLEKMKFIQEKYFQDIFNSEDENVSLKLKVWALCGLIRISASASSEVAQTGFSLLDELPEDLHLPIIARVPRENQQILEKILLTSHFKIGDPFRDFQNAKKDKLVKNTMPIRPHTSKLE